MPNPTTTTHARTDGLSERLWPTEPRCCRVCLTPAVWNPSIRARVHRDRGDNGRCNRIRRNGGQP